MKLHTILILAAAIAASACGSGGKNGMPAQRHTEQKEQTAQGARSRTLRRPTVPIEESITVEKRRAWLAGHFWDDYPFEAETDPTLYDTLDMCRALAEYVSECVTPENADSLLGGLMRRAHCSRPMLDYFAMLADEVLHDPNSPLRNDEYYIPVLRVLVASPYYDEYDRIAPQYALDMALRNRPGEAANDFAYTLADGRSRRMHDIETDYLLILFNNPGCPACRQITDDVTASPLLNELGERGAFKVLAIYPDTDLDAWRDYLPQMPEGWINAYDGTQALTRERLYDLRAIPSIYLLDRGKHVLVKDGINVEQIEYAVMEHQANTR
ncbi:hypothetical protein IMSAGC022_00604 [Alistipes sp.]|nr:hypothetical protein IMSAGC022_00604 [Alistipes sp.]